MRQALTLLGVGMISVFVVLAIVVLTGRVLIQVTNRLNFSVQRPTGASTATSSRQKNAISSVDEHELVVLAAVVDHLTAGRGRLVSYRPKEPSEKSSS